VGATLASAVVKSLAVLVPATALAMACSGTSTSSPRTTESTLATSDPPGAVCGQRLSAGLAKVACEGMSFDVSVPPRCADDGCGLIVDVHGYSVDGAFAERHTGLQALGTAAGYVVVQPNSPKSSWEAGVDDDRVYRFLQRIVVSLSLDRDRIHFGGFSQGAFMTWRFVCDHADLIASAAPIAAGASAPDEDPPGVSCDFDGTSSPAEEVDILYVHGTHDADEPFAAAVHERDLVVHAWSMVGPEVVADEPDYRWYRWTSPKGTVFEFVEHDWSGGVLGGHCYPGASAQVGCGDNTAVDYGEAALQFYIDHPKHR
jgi:poly(3-hydroxybutyrate) depolymerase